MHLTIINELNTKVAAKVLSYAEDAVKAGATAGAGVVAYKVQQGLTHRSAQKEFKETATGSELYSRLNNYIEKYKELKSKKQSISALEYTTRAKRIEKKIIAIKREISVKEREYRF